MKIYSLSYINLYRCFHNYSRSSFQIFCVAFIIIPVDSNAPPVFYFVYFHFFVKNIHSFPFSFHSSSKSVSNTREKKYCRYFYSVHFISFHFIHIYVKYSISNILFQFHKSTSFIGFSLIQFQFLFVCVCRAASFYLFIYSNYVFVSLFQSHLNTALHMQIE